MRRCLAGNNSSVKTRNATPLPHRLPGDPKERQTPILPPDEIPKPCPECEDDPGKCRECGGTRVLRFATDDESVSEQPCDECAEDPGKCACCLGRGTVTNANYQLWLSGLR